MINKTNSAIKNIFFSLIIFLFHFQLIAMVCTSNGNEVPCSALWLPLVIIPTVGILVFAFWLYMLIDAIKNQEKDKLVWVFVIVATNIIGSLIYFFICKRKRSIK